LNLEVHIVDPKKKNIILISVAVVALGYVGYSFLFAGSSSNAQSQQTKLVKKTRDAVEGGTKKTIKKKASVKSATKKKGLVKKVAQDRQKNTLKKKRGKRGGRKTKKKEIAPAA